MRTSTLVPLFFTLLSWFTSIALAIERPDHTRVANKIRQDICDYDGATHTLGRRASVEGEVGVGVTLPQVGVSLGNITTKLGNINLTVTNVTISVGDIDVENIAIGNITIIVSVPLPGASPINAFSAYTPATSIATSTAAPTSTVSPGTSVSSPATTATGTAGLAKRQEPEATTTTVDLSTTTASSTGVSVGASATVSANPVTLDAGSVYTEIGNISIFVGHVNVSLGNVKIKNVTLGNILVLVQIGQPDLTGALGNVTNALRGIGSGR